MLTLRQIVLREIRLPLKEPFRISSGTVEDRRIILLELHDRDGSRGWAECVAAERPNYSPETVETAWYVIRDFLAPRLLGRDLPGPEAVEGVLQEGVCGHRMARAALEMGCWELAAGKEGVSLARLLGGSRQRVATGISVGIQESPEALLQKARTSVEAGYRKVKLKIRPGEDLEFVRAVREGVGPEVPLAVDANAAYTLDDADRLARLDAFDLLMVEQPLDREDLVRHAELQRRLRTPICLDESITGPDRLEDMVTLRSGKIVNVKPGRVGGFGPSLRIHDLCREHDLPLWCGGMLESGIGRAHNVALASLPGFTLPGDLSPSSRYWERDIVEPEWTMDGDGWVDVPTDRPGMGVEVREDRVEELTVRTEILRADRPPSD